MGMRIAELPKPAAHDLSPAVVPELGGRIPATGSETFRLSELAGLEGDTVLKGVAEWITKYLMRPHADLGRPGPVCPFVAGARMRDSVRIAVVRLRERDRSEQVKRTVLNFKTAFMNQRSPRAEDELYKVI